MTGYLKGLSRNRDGTQDVCITLEEDISELYTELQNVQVDVEIKKHYAKRSLDANALCWYLIDKIAAVKNIKKSEVYREAIKDIGGVSDVVCAKNIAVNALIAAWTVHGQGWQAEVEPSKLPGCSNVTLYYGSSVYNTRQMAALIDSLIQDAEALGIPKPSQKTIDKSMELWTRKKEKKNDNVTPAA